MDPVTQKPVWKSTAQVSQEEKKLALAQDELYGGHLDKDGKFVPTLAREKWTEDNKQNYIKLAEDARSNRANEAIAWADRTGFAVGKPGAVEFSDFQTAFDEFNRSGKVDIGMDFNSDGKIDMEDYFIGADKGMIVADGSVVTTLERQKLDQDIKTAAQTFGLSEKEFELKLKQFNEGLTQWKSTFTGYLWDANGQAYVEEPKYSWETIDTPIYDRATNKGTLPDGTAFSVKNMTEVVDAKGNSIGWMSGGSMESFVLSSTGQTIDLTQTSKVTKQVQLGTTKRYVRGLEAINAKNEQDRWEKEFEEKLREFDAELALKYKTLSVEKKKSLWAIFGQVIEAGGAVAAAAMGKPPTG